MRRPLSALALTAVAVFGFTTPASAGPQAMAELNESERKICAENPIRCLAALAVAKVATDESTSAFPSQSYDGTQRDAARHCMWQSLLSADHGSAYAKRWGDAHEENPAPPASHEMDFHNNAVARAWGGQLARNKLVAHCTTSARAAAFKDYGDKQRLVYIVK
ncbi:hypothetical protein GCM10022247_24810 [Allokutzneria multivorans]|uniref:DUF6973 domain-containing protein n=1 Tax=Allokutzneria multivorans TaxID=1142134 RepID=A0ABP7RW69_9PSEU